MIRIVCVNSGDFYSNEYVNILADSIVRNISDEISVKFTCFTNNPQGLDIDIDVMPLPVELEGRGWFNKLYLFKNYLFPDNDRIIYFDLKNVIVSDITSVLQYDGGLAILRDFFTPRRWQSSLMSWKANTLGDIWDLYVSHKYPKIEGGDQVWIQNCFTNQDRLFTDDESFYPFVGAVGVDYWQDLLPDAFHSYKASGCISGIPKNAKIVFFHGEPRPDQITDGWVPQVWKIGGVAAFDSMSKCNTPRDVVISNIRQALTMPVNRYMEPVPAHERHVVIVGGGPSIKGYVNELKTRAEHGQHIVAINNSWRWCEENGIHVGSQVMVDARDGNIDFVPSSESSIKRLYATQCSPAVLQAAGTEHLTLWDNLILDLVPDFDNTNSMFWIGAGTTAGVRSIYLMYVLGYRNFHIYGFDSSYEDGQGHAYEQKLNVGERVIDISLGDRKFRAAPWMVAQVHDFLETMDCLLGGVEYVTNKDCIFTIHWDGLLQYAAAIGLVPTAVEQRSAEILKRNTTGE